MVLGITVNGWLQLGLYVCVLTALAVPLGAFMARVLSGERHFLSPVLGPAERLLFTLCGVKPDQETNWKDYALGVIAFSVAGFLLLFVLLSTQAWAPLNPQKLPNLPPDLAFNTAASFLTNTNWQSYAGETTLSYFSQMVGLTVQNFVSASVGIAVLAALIRGLARHSTDKVGNFWTDTIRVNLFILLPLSLIVSVALASQGVIQTFDAYVTGKTLEGVDQVIALGPVASQEAIKMLGTNGGGFFNTNSAHPFENPTPLSNFIEMLAIAVIPAALCFTFGRMVGDRRQGAAIFIAMTAVFLTFAVICIGLEQAGNPHLVAIGAHDAATVMQAGGNMEGKETRFGISATGIFAAITTAVSCGAVNGMHDSFTPLGGLVPMLLMMFGEVIYGGVGSGLYGMLLFVVLTVFIAGLMVGRTPEYLGKKIGAYEIKMATIAVLLPCAFVLTGTAIAVLTPMGREGIYNPGAQGFSEVLYAFTSASNNNGSAFAGLGANTPFYNTILGVCMLFGRFFVMLPVLAIAGSLAAKKAIPVSTGTLPTHTPLFIGILIGVIVLVGVLTYAPALALGPVVEHIFMIKG